METFYLQNGSGLVLTHRDADSNNKVLELAKLDFSYEQIWFWQGKSLMCGTGMVLDCQWNYVVSVNSRYTYPEFQKFYFQEFKDDKFYIGKFENEDENIKMKDKFLTFEENEDLGRPLAQLIPIEGSDKSFHWKKVPSDDAYQFVLMDSKTLPKNSFAAGKDKSDTFNVFVGRGDFGGDLHVGKVHNGNRSIGYHNEDKMVSDAFYLQNESGLYLTQPESNYLTLEELNYSPVQMWYWTSPNPLEGYKSELKCGAEKNLKLDNYDQVWATKVGEVLYSDEKPFFYYSKIEDGQILIGKYVEKEDEKSENNETHMFLGVTKGSKGVQRSTKMRPLGESELQFKWKKIPTNQSYQWFEMDSEILPENAFSVGKGENDTCDVFVGKGEINGKLHPGNVCNGIRSFKYHCPGIGKYKHHCNHCCRRNTCSLITTVSSEKFSVLCVEPDSEVEWIEFEFQFLPFFCDWGKFPSGAVVGGTRGRGRERGLYYVGRGIIDNKIAAGFFQLEENDTKLVAFHEGEIHELTKFEMLVVRKKGEGKLKIEKENVKNEKHYFGTDNMEKMVTDEKFSVLCLDPNAIFEWVHYEGGKIPKGSVFGGFFGGRFYYVGRGIIQNQIIPGMFFYGNVNDNRETDTDIKPCTLYALYDGEMHQMETFEVLVVLGPVHKAKSRCTLLLGIGLLGIGASITFPWAVRMIQRLSIYCPIGSFWDTLFGWW